ncbi:MAG: YrbL family protein, partial [Rhodanobacteraceae bacterium]
MDAHVETYTTPTPATTLRLAGATPIAIGQLRAVYQHPLHRDELVKVIRPGMAEARLKRRSSWLKRLPRAKHYVGYLREIKEYVAARARTPDRDPPIARMIGVIDTDLGLGLVTEKVVDADGALAPTLAAMYERSRGFTPAIDTALATFLEGLLACNVIVGDMHAWNIVYGSDSRGPD